MFPVASSLFFYLMFDHKLIHYIKYNDDLDRSFDELSTGALLLLWTQLLSKDSVF